MTSPEHQTRTGLAFFTLYLIFYAAFVLISAFEPTIFERQTAGITWAVLAGMALILGAIALAVLYCWVCREQPAAPQEPRA